MTTHPPSRLEVFDSIQAMAAQVDFWRREGERVACVPTMGALHDGHAALCDRAREVADRVVVSIFVNPLQFGPGEDFERYPRTLERDLEVLRSHGVDAVMLPAVEDMYPDWPTTTPTEDPGVVGEVFEGAARPGHFAGMLTVVRRLMEGISATEWVFGEKDAQQLFLIRQMVAKRGLPVTLHSVPTVREADGLALSSRNQYLTADERRDALALSRELRHVESALHLLPEWTAEGVSAVVAEGRAHLSGSPGIHLDYVEAVSPQSFQPPGDPVGGELQLIVAARVGTTRLIDQRIVHRQETAPPAAQ